METLGFRSAILLHGGIKVANVRAKLSLIWIPRGQEGTTLYRLQGYEVDPKARQEGPMSERPPGLRFTYFQKQSKAAQP